MFLRTEHAVTFSLSDEQYQALMLVLDAAASIPQYLHLSLQVANWVNEGNPKWTPYVLTGNPETPKA